MQKKIYHASFVFSCFLAIILLLGFKSNAQQVNLKWISLVEGVEVHPIFHASLELKGAGRTLLIDPSFDSDLLADLKAPDLILLTDIHGDHLNVKILSQIEAKFGATPIIAPKAVADQLPEELRKLVIVLKNGETKNWENVSIEAIPMYNLGEGDNIFHPRGRGNGYLVTLAAKRIYISGDTEATSDLRGLKDVDLAFVCMNMPFTMDIDQAAAGVIDFQPKVVVPYHYKGSGGLSDIASFGQKVQAAGKNIKVRLLNFYP